jgi:DNA-binding CsgD family transcriptional regulator
MAPIFDVKRFPSSTDNEQGFSRQAANALAGSSLPALILEAATERIVAASVAGAKLLAPDGSVVVGRSLEDFTADEPSGGLRLFAGGRLTGIEIRRTLWRRGGPDLGVKIRVRHFDRQTESRFVLATLCVDSLSDDGAAGEADCPDPPAVVAMVDASVSIERISSDGMTWFGWSVADLLGRPLVDLIADKDVTSCLAAIAEAAANQRGVTLFLDVSVLDEGARQTAGSRGCEVLILPLQPTPSCALVFLPTPGKLPTTHTSRELSAVLKQLGRAAESPSSSGPAAASTEPAVPGLGALTTRELEMVAYLRDGDRPPAIARKLFISQSTVRNHLGAVFTKLGVTSQQQLVDLFRGEG